MWNVPPFGRLRTSARMTLCVSCSTSFAHARRACALAAVHGQKRLRHSDGDLRRLERHHGPVAADDFVVGQCGVRRESAGARLTLCADGTARRRRRRKSWRCRWFACAKLLVFDGAERPRIEMRAVRGVPACCFVAVHYCCQPRTTMKLKMAKPGQLPVPLLRSGRPWSSMRPVRLKPTKTTSLATPVCLGLSN